MAIIKVLASAGFNGKKCLPWIFRIWFFGVIIFKKFICLFSSASGYSNGSPNSAMDEWISTSFEVPIFLALWVTTPDGYFYLIRATSSKLDDYFLHYLFSSMRISSMHKDVYAFFWNRVQMKANRGEISTLRYNSSRFRSRTSRILPSVTACFSFWQDRPLLGRGRIKRCFHVRFFP